VTIVPEVKVDDYMEYMEDVVARASRELVEADKMLILAERRERRIREICQQHFDQAVCREIVNLLDGR
jgi:hypothetical protein